MTEKHTPTPWKIESHGKMGLSKRIVTAAPKDVDGLVNGKYYYDIIDSGAYGDQPTLPDDADLEHIVHCVNMHTELVEALKPFANLHCNDDTCQCNNCVAHKVLLKATKEG